MGTKLNPGRFDCWSKAADDEPMFVLLGRDPVAPLVVKFWRALREVEGQTSQEKLDEATQCARDMEKFAIARGKRDRVEAIKDKPLGAIIDAAMQAGTIRRP